MFDEVDWGTAGEWASAIGALVLIGVTFWLWRHERAVNKRAEERRASTAVNTWVELRRFAFWVIVVNSGADPITDWSVSIRDNSDQSWQPLIHNRNRGILAPGRLIEAPIQDVNSTVVPTSFDNAVVQVTFIDVEGRKWWRQGGESRHV